MSDRHPPVRIVIADDHALVRDGLRKLLELQPEFVVVGEASDGLDAVRQAKALKPDVLLLDLAMPRMNGLEVLKELAGVAPEVKTVLVTASIEREETVRAITLGARGVVLKESAAQLLFSCIRAVMNGEFWVGHQGVGDLVQHVRRGAGVPADEPRPASRLTPRELQVVGAIVEGSSNKDIGRTFGVTEQTVKNHLSSIFDKLGVSNRLELALYAVHHRLLAAGTAARAGVAGRTPGSSDAPAKYRK